MPGAAAILTNGGAACPLNALILSAREALKAEGFEVIYGIMDGYEGLIKWGENWGNEQIYAECHYPGFTEAPIDPKRGGSILRSVRASPCRTEGDRYVIDENKAEAIKRALEELEIEALVVIGGDGTAATTRLLIEWFREKEVDIKVFFLPRTIDNDIGVDGTSIICPGFPSGIAKIAKATVGLRVDADTCRRVYVQVTQGRDAGWLVGGTMLGRADFILIPEVDFEDVRDLLFEGVRRRFSTRRSVIVGVSEGLKNEGQTVASREFGRQLTGAGAFVAEEIRENTGLEARTNHTDYTPRTGDPIEYDIKLAELIGNSVREMLHQGDTGLSAVLRLSMIAPYDQLSQNCIEIVSIDAVRKCYLPIDRFYDAGRLYFSREFFEVLKVITTGPGNKEMVF